MCSDSSWASRSRRAAYPALASLAVSSAVRRWAVSVVWPRSRSSRAAWVIRAGPAIGFLARLRDCFPARASAQARARGGARVARPLPAAIAAWCSCSMARSMAARSASSWRHHSTMVCGSSFGFGLLLPGCLLRESAPLQLGAGFPGCFPPAAGVGGPCLVAGVRGFELLALGRQVAGERRRVRRSDRSCLISASADCCQASASAWAVSRSSRETSGGALARARSPSRIRASSSPWFMRRMISVSSRSSRARIAAWRRWSSSGLPRWGPGAMAWPGSVIPAASR